MATDQNRIEVTTRGVLSMLFIKGPSALIGAGMGGAEEGVSLLVNNTKLGRDIYKSKGVRAPYKISNSFVKETIGGFFDDDEDEEDADSVL
jgi:hypothetical protein